jgi:endonuclease-8
MPEGDTVRRAAASLQPLVGPRLAAEAPHPRTRSSGLAEALAGCRLAAVGARGKHLLLCLEDGRVLHSHLGMRGSWSVRLVEEAGARRRDAWLVLRAGELVATQANGSVLELLDERRLRLHPTLSRLGPDVLAPDFAPELAAGRLLACRDGRTVGELLLDQHVACGIGNIHRCETLFARRVDPFADPRALGLDEVAALYGEASRRMAAAVRGARERPSVHRRRVCPRCGGRIATRPVGDEGRTLYWCPACQRPRAAAARASG